MLLRDNENLPDLHSQLPAVRIPVASVGHLGVKRIVPIEELGTAAMFVMDIAIGLLPSQRGAHLSRLIECIDRPGSYRRTRDYAHGIFERLIQAVPTAASWSLYSTATLILPQEGGLKPIDEIYRLEKGSATSVTATWGAAFKVCLACPQAQAAIAFGLQDSNIGSHPSHNQLSELEISITGDATIGTGHAVSEFLAIGEEAASGPVRELYKRCDEARAVSAVHQRAVFAEDALRSIADKLRTEFPESHRVTCRVVNYESIYEYPLSCTVTA
jgi:GTP cyclohydrolase FolE2